MWESPQLPAVESIWASVRASVCSKLRVDMNRAHTGQFSTQAFPHQLSSQTTFLRASGQADKAEDFIDYGFHLCASLLECSLPVGRSLGRRLWVWFLGNANAQKNYLGEAILGQS